MVNIQITCPRCDHFKDCAWKGSFITAVDEPALYNRSTRVSCPFKRRVIYLDKVNYFVLEATTYEKQETDIHKTSGSLAKARGKYTQKGKKELLDKLREREQSRRYGKKHPK